MDRNCSENLLKRTPTTSPRHAISTNRPFSNCPSAPGINCFAPLTLNFVAGLG